MFGARKKKRKPDYVDPDLPITPMLDMSFQLMAFFIFTFRPAPTEGQILLALPKLEGGPSTVAPSLTDDKPVTFVVRVNSTSDGKIAGMTLLTQGSADVRPEDLGADTKRYDAALRARYAGLKGSPGKLTLEIGDGLLQDYVVNLLDIAVQTGFTDISPIPMDPKKR